MTKAPDFSLWICRERVWIYRKRMKRVIKSELKAFCLIGCCYLSWEAEPEWYSFLFQLSYIFYNFDCDPCFCLIHLHCLSKQRPWVLLSLLLLLFLLFHIFLLTISPIIGPFNHDSSPELDDVFFLNSDDALFAWTFLISHNVAIWIPRNPSSIAPMCIGIESRAASLVTGSSNKTEFWTS